MRDIKKIENTGYIPPNSRLLVLQQQKESSLIAMVSPFNVKIFNCSSVMCFFVNRNLFNFGASINKIVLSTFRQLIYVATSTGLYQVDLNKNLQVTPTYVNITN